MSKRYLHLIKGLYNVLYELNYNEINIIYCCDYYYLYEFCQNWQHCMKHTIYRGTRTHQVPTYEICT